MIGAIGRLVLLVAALLVALTYLLLRGATPDAAQHERTLDALRSVLLSEAALENDVLSARAGMLRNYDPIVASMATLRNAAVVLLESAESAQGKSAAELRTNAESLAAVVAQQEELVNEFKARNAILHNSLNFFSHASAAPSVRATQTTEELAGAVAALATAMLAYLRDARPISAAPVTAALDRLAQAAASPDDEPQRSLVAHGRIILNALPRVDDVVSRIVMTEVDVRAQAYHDRYLEQHGRAEARAETFRWLLYGSAVLLVGYLAYLFWRLRSNAAALSARLGFERLIAEISADFINVPREGLSMTVEHALMRLAGRLGADGAYILLGEPGGEHPRSVHQWFAHEARSRSASLKEAFAAASERSDQMGGPPPCLRARGVRSWLCLSMSCAGRRLGFVCFESTRRTRWGEGDLILLGTAAEIFANAFDRERTEMEREELEAQLRQAQRLEAVGTLAGGIAHEFNNTLGAILGYSEMALARLPPGEPTRRHVKQVMTAGRRAKEVVDQVLAFARRAPTERRPLRVQAAVEEALELLRVSLPPTLKTTTRFASAEASVLGDPGQLQQVVVNLCSNAAQAMRGRGVVEVALASVTLGEEAALSHGSLAPGDYVRLTVADSGPGIGAAAMHRLFEPFFTTKAPGEGTGLGLATVHGIVLKHGGALNVRSSSGGTTFEVYLPRLSGAAAVLADDEKPLPTGNGEAVLLVDDERPLVLLGEEMLAALGYEAVGSSSPVKALEAVRADPERFALILTDEVMPEMTGAELAGAIHSLRPDLPIILMTGSIGPTAADRLSAAGVREVLQKPLLARDIAESLARHLRPAA